jgi:hypothetical protein
MHHSSRRQRRFAIDAERKALGRLRRLDEHERASRMSVDKR